MKKINENKYKCNATQDSHEQWTAFTANNDTTGDQCLTKEQHNSPIQRVETEQMTVEDPTTNNRIGVRWQCGHT